MPDLSQQELIEADHINNAVQRLLDDTTELLDAIMCLFVEIEFGWIRSFWLYGERHATMV